MKKNKKPNFICNTVGGIWGKKKNYKIENAMFTCLGA